MSDRNCANCQYLMKVPTGIVCNAFKKPSLNLCADNNCTEWVELDLLEEKERDRLLQQRVEGKKGMPHLYVRNSGQTILIDDVADLTPEQIDRGRQNFEAWAERVIGIDLAPHEDFIFQYLVRPRNFASEYETRFLPQDPVLVLAGSYRQYLGWVRTYTPDQRCSLQSTYIHSPVQIIGMRPPLQLIKVGDYWLNPLYGSAQLEILEAEIARYRSE